MDIRLLISASVTKNLISDTELQFTGSWTFVNDSTVVPEGNHSCHITQAAGDQAQYSFKGAFYQSFSIISASTVTNDLRLPRAGSSIELAGLTNASAGLFNISLTSDSVAIQQQQLSGLSSFLTYTTLFYASGLNPNTTHTLTVINAENKTLALESMNITVVDGGERYVAFGTTFALVGDDGARSLHRSFW